MDIDFSKGIYNKSKPITTPKGYYFDAVNIRATGNAKRTEEGNVKISVPSNFIQWGECSIGDETILLGEIGGKSVIGSIDKSDLWTQEISPRAGSDILGIFQPTQVEGKKNWAGERVIYFATPKGARRINLDTVIQTVPDADFDKSTLLFLAYDLPKVSYVGETSGGTVSSGIYEIAARLVTESGATSPFGLMSNIMYVVPANLNSARETVTGAPPQTPTTKALNLNISNIDTTFKYIQLGILTYEGLSNTPVIRSSTLIPINGQKNINYTFRGSADYLDTISIEELIVSGISYTTASYVTQKDGALLLGAPVEAAQPAVDWYRMAMNITSKFIIKKIPYKENLKFEYTNMSNPETMNLKETSTEPMDQGYKNPVTCTLYKGFRRNEVYAFTLTPVFTSGVLGPTVLIPADHNLPTEASNSSSDLNLGGSMGTYISEEKFVANTYPGITASDGLRLHKFPSAKQQPIIEGSIEDNTCNIRVLGIEFSNIQLDPSELQYASQIAGYIIGMVDRKGNESQLAQGIVRPHTKTSFNGQAGYSSMLGDGFVSWDNGIKGSGTYKSVENPILTDFNFLAPDIIHGLYSINDGSHIAQHSVYKCKPFYEGFHTRINNAWGGGNFSLPKTFFKNVVGIAATATTNSLDTTKVELEGNRVMVQAFGVSNAPKDKGGKKTVNLLRGSKVISMCSSDGFAWLGSSIPIKYHRPVNFLYRCIDYLSYDYASSRSSWCEPVPVSANSAAMNTYRTDFVVHTMVRNNVKQYGSLDQMTSIYVDYIPTKNFNGTAQVFNGDTFINKYGLTVNDESAWPWSIGDGGDSGRNKPINANGIIYFWLESSNNYDYRHYIMPATYSEESIDDKGTVPFFPAYKQLVSTALPAGILSLKADNWVRPGYASQYNNQYSARQNIKPYVLTPKEDIERKSSLLNRIIYSATAIQGEKSDAYQIFSANNYYDVPQEFGELTDIYVLDDLYASTPQVQWRLFFNTMAAQITTVGQMVLGTGGAFPRPAVPMTTVDGGFAGTSHWTHAVNTLFGRIFIDRVQGKLINLQQGMKVLSDDWDDKYRTDIQKIGNDSIKLGYEPLRDRVFIQLGGTMWSYDLLEGVFTSKYSFSPRWMFTHGSYMYSGLSNQALGLPGTYKHGVGASGVFYGVRYESSITFVVNEAFTASKEFKSLEFLTKVTSEDGLNKPFKSFNKIEVWNDERYSGVNTLKFKDNAFMSAGILEILLSKVKDSFRLSIPRDIVKDPNINIFTPNNHAQVISDTTPATWLPKMKGSYVLIKLITTNTEGPLHLFSAKVEVVENIR